MASSAAPTSTPTGRRRSRAGRLGDAADDAALDELAVTAAVEDLLAPLGERQREVLWQRIIEGRSSAEVAALLETTAGNIDVIVHRALATHAGGAR